MIIQFTHITLPDKQARDSNENPAQKNLIAVMRIFCAGEERTQKNEFKLTPFLLKTRSKQNLISKLFVSI